MSINLKYLPTVHKLGTKLRFHITRYISSEMNDVWMKDMVNHVTIMISTMCDQYIGTDLRSVSNRRGKRELPKNLWDTCIYTFLTCSYPHGSLSTAGKRGYVGHLPTLSNELGQRETLLWMALRKEFVSIEVKLDNHENHESVWPPRSLYITGAGDHRIHHLSPCHRS